MFDKRRFKAAVALKGYSMRKIAKELNIDETTLYREINGQSDFFRREIRKLCDLFEIQNPSKIFLRPILRKHKKQEGDRMNELATYQGGLPSQPDDLAKFIVVAQEKIKAVKAEIRAIRRLEMAKEVYDQKIAEQARLQELTLLAYQRMGEITREMPKDSGGRPQKTVPTSGKSFENEPTARQREVTKTQAVQDLGLFTSQVSRMEQMAAHPEIVDEVIAESQAGQVEATQVEVLRRVKEQKDKVVDFADARKQRYDADMAQIDRDYGNLKLFRKAVSFAGLCQITDEILDSVVEADSGLPTTIQDLNELIGTVATIGDKLITKGANHGKTSYHKRNQGPNL